jgi:hypothetical protein
MIPKLKSAEYVKDHTIRLQFEDGVAGDVDFKGELWGEVFEGLEDPDVFRRFRLDDELNTIAWPSGADFAPEFLYEKAAQQAHAAGKRRSGARG